MDWLGWTLLIISCLAWCVNPFFNLLPYNTHTYNIQCSTTINGRFNFVLLFIVWFYRYSWKLKINNNQIRALTTKLLISKHILKYFYYCCVCVCVNPSRGYCIHIVDNWISMNIEWSAERKKCKYVRHRKNYTKILLSINLIHELH